MAHSLPEIEKDALRLSAEDRARLVVRLLSSFEETTRITRGDREALDCPQSRDDAFKNCATELCKVYPLARSLLSCGISACEGNHLPPGSSGGDARSSRVL